MRRFMWPGIIFVLVGALVALHAATLVYAVSSHPGEAGPASTARPRAGWSVSLSAPHSQGVVVDIADAGGSPLADARVSVVVPASGETSLALAAPGRFTGAIRAAAGMPVRVVVHQGGHIYSFDRIMPGPEVAP